MIWQKQDKYVWFLNPFPHYQIEKFNGTKGNITLMPNNIGVLDEVTGMYEFKEIKDDYMNRIVKAKIFLDLLKPLDGKLVKFKDSLFDGEFADETERVIHIWFEIRLIKAKTKIDVDVARIYYEAAQIDRLSVKAALMRLMQ